MRVAVDSNVFVYALSGHEQWGKPAAALFKAMDRGQLNGIASVVAITEVTGQPRGATPEVVERLQRFMEGLDGIDYFPVDLEVAILAGRLRAEYGPKLHAPDSLHLATAICQGADVFVTNDAVLRKLKLDGLVTRGLDEPLSEAA